MVTRIEVSYKVGVPDAARKLRQQSLIGCKVLQISDVYTLDKKVTPAQLKLIHRVFYNPVIQKVGSKLPPEKFNWVIEIGYLPGVTDNIANTAKEAVEDLLKKSFSDKEGIYSSQLTYLSGSLSLKDAERIANSLANTLIQRIHIKSFKQFKKDKGMDSIVPKVTLTKKPEINDVNLNVDDQELTRIGKAGILNNDGTRAGPLALDLLYMKAIKSHFKKLKRNPTDIEIESIAQTWSEHCKHTIFANPIDNIKKGLFKSHIRAATEKIRQKKGKNDICVSVFKDNSGAIIFDDQYLVTHKVETHNSPSALDPFGGSITGIVGVNRDTIGFGLGAKPIINTYGFCLADPKDKTVLYRDSSLTQQMLSPRRIMDGVIAGVNSGGNCSGIPTPQGFVYFDPRYKGKPLVFAGTVGLIPRKINGRKSYDKQALAGDYIVMVGGRVGIDGIHGATFSSEALDTGSPATAVQIGDPITQKKLSDALVKEANVFGLFNSITDNGAGGLSSSVAEMAKESNGCKVYLDLVPLKYPGLEPWQIWISESQERMTLAIPKNKWSKFNKLMKSRGVEATVIGEFTKNGKCQVFYHKKLVVNLDMEFLHNGLPVKNLKTVVLPAIVPEPEFKEPKDLADTLDKMLANLNLTSFEFISAQYDHEVQSSSVLKPLQGAGRINADASVVRPVFNSLKGVALSQGYFPSYSEIDSYQMAANSIDAATRNLVVVGADPEKIALLDNFCWCSSNDPQRLRQLKQATLACYDYAVAFGTPFISGKDSMFNDFSGFDHQGQSLKISIPPTLLISSISVINDVTKTVSLDAKVAGDLVYLLGRTDDVLGGSEYYAMLGLQGNKTPRVDAKRNKKLYQSYFKAVNQSLVSSAIAVSRGGLAIALAKTSIGGMLGMEINLKNLGKSKRHDSFLFSESSGRILVTINPGNKLKFEKLFKGQKITLLGQVTDNKDFTIRVNNNLLIKSDITKLSKFYKSRLKDY